jgi:hypothetical protein
MRLNNRRQFQNISGDSVALSPGSSKRKNRDQQSGAEALVRKFSASSVHNDALIPFCLRTLEHAQSELQHDGLALAISAAEWHYCDLVIWQSYPIDFARAEAWKHVEIGIGWVMYLRRMGGVKP